MARRPAKLNLDIAVIRDSMLARWGVVDWDKLYPWWRKPAKVRILLYADSPVLFTGGPFLGLQYVSTLLTTRAYFYVDFEVSSAHRDGIDTTASIGGARKLTDLDIQNKFDQIWLFGFNETPNLDPGEVAALEQFMSAPKYGGILVTGDHADLGKGIAGQIPRAGMMRQYPAPEAVPPGWNVTLEDGPDAGNSFDFEDQSDDRPQTIRYRRFSMGHVGRSRPHPVLCGPDGPINVLPDHQHEGEALAPIPAAGDPVWPTKLGHQERPEVIAWGRIKDPAATKHGQEIGVISTYDGHNVDVGRILADSTWHHWFDINLTGIAAPPSPYAGFDDTPTGQAALKKIEAYYLNCGVWLAPPQRQRAMRNAAWWSILWTDRVVELSPDSPLARLGETAIDALGRRASRCAVTEWVFDSPIFKEKIPRWEWPQLLPRIELVDVPFEAFVAGGILRRLMTEVGPAQANFRFPARPPDDDQLERLLIAGTEEGLNALSKQLQDEVVLATRFVKAGFRAHDALRAERDDPRWPP